MEKTKVKENSKRTEKGITLLALVVTIIIMLILVGITLNATIGDHGIIKEAKSTVNDYEKAQEDEQSSLETIREQIAKNRKKEIKVSSKIIDINGNEVTEKQEEGTILRIQLTLIKDTDMEITSVKDSSGNIIAGNNLIYTSEDITKNGEYIFKISYTLNGNTQLEKEIKVNMNKIKINYIGKYVKYEPDKATYSKDLLGENYTGSSNNSSDFTTEEYTDGWRILDYDDETGEMIIVMATQTKKLYLGGVRGYNNGVDVLNNMAATLFSKKTDGWNVEARSMKIEDIEDRFNEAGITARDEYIFIDEFPEESEVQYNYTKDYNTNRKYPLLYANEIGSGITGTGTVKTTGLGRSERNPNVSYNASDVQDAEAPTKLTVTQTYYNLELNTSYFKEEDYLKLFDLREYWLASRCVGCWSEDVGFGIGSASGAGVRGISGGIAAQMIYASHGYGQGDTYNGLRAVVSLGPGVKITGSETGTNKDNAITISK